MKPVALNDLKALTDSIKEGKRVVMIPPGIFSLILLILLLITSTVTFFGSAISIFAADTETSIKASIQLASLVLLFIFVIFPSLMIFSGKKQFSIISLYYAVAILFISCLILAGAFANQVSIQNSLTPLVICIASCVASIFVYKSPSFLLIKEFFYLLKK